MEHTESEKALFIKAQEIARKIISGEIEPAKGCEEINKIRIELGFPEELEYWGYLDDGGSAEWLDRTFIRGVLKFNYQKWLEAVMLNAKYLAKPDFLDN